MALALPSVLLACTISPSSSTSSPRPTAQPNATSAASSNPIASANPSAAASPSANPSSAPGGAGLIRCDSQIPAGDTLVIGAVGADPGIVIRDIQDPANAKTVCRFDPGVLNPQFVSATRVAYETSQNQIVVADLASGITKVIATFSPGFGSGLYSVSPDGASVTYLDGNAWHLISGPGNKVLTTLPPVPNRGLNPDEDDTFLSFSPDGLYIALVQTVHVGGTGQTAPDQVRKASDGSLVYSTSGMTMGVWASVPSRLFFRDAAGTTVHRWDPATGSSSMMPMRWIRPKSSPDGRWIAYTFKTNNVDQVGFYSVQSNSVSATSPTGRAGTRFLNNDLVWYFGEKPCDTCFGGQPTPTGLTYIYSIAGTSEVVSRLASVYDAWPRSTPPGV
jgi:hypothetical protein